MKIVTRRFRTPPCRGIPLAGSGCGAEAPWDRRGDRGDEAQGAHNDGGMLRAGWAIKYNRRTKFCSMERPFANSTVLVIGYNGYEYAILLRTYNNLMTDDATHAFNIQFHRGSNLPKK